jgi:3-methyladenine DNA glycosylase AlkD
MILDYYISDEYKDKIYHIIQNVNNDAYYVKMANAWLLSYMFIKCFNDTINFINHNKIDKWTLSKGISKACESFRISQEEKNILKKIQEHVKEKD